MKPMICIAAILAVAHAGVLSGAGDFGGGSYFSSSSGGGSQNGGGGHHGGASFDSSSLLSDALSNLGSSGSFLSSSSGGYGPIVSGGSIGHGPIVSSAPAVRHYNLNLPLPNHHSLTYTSARAVQVLRPATLRVVARPVSVNVVKSVAVEEHAPRTVQGTLLVNKPTTVTVAKPVTLQVGSSGAGHSGGFGGHSFGGHSGSLNLGSFGDHSSGGGQNFGSSSGGHHGGWNAGQASAISASSLGW